MIWIANPSRGSTRNPIAKTSKSLGQLKYLRDDGR